MGFRIATLTRVKSISIELSTLLTVGYDGDDNEIESAVVVALDWHPADHEAGVSVGSWEISSVRYAGDSRNVAGYGVPKWLLPKSLLDEWKDEAERVTFERERDAKDAAGDDKDHARRDGER